MVRGSCIIECKSTDGRANKHEVCLKEGDHIVLQADQGGVVSQTLCYTASTADPGTVIATT